MLKRYSDPKILDEFLHSGLKEIEKMIVLDRIVLFPVELAHAGFIEEVPALFDVSWKKVEKGHFFAPDGGCWWLRKRIRIPAVDKGTLTALKFLCGDAVEGLLYINGKICSGICTADWDSRQPVVLPDNLEAGKEIEILIHIYSGRDWGTLRRFGPQELKEFELLTISKTNQNLFDAFSVALEAAVVMDRMSPYSQEIINCLEKVYLMLDFTDREKYSRGAVDSLKYLEENVYNGGNMQPVTVGLFGHSHIDVAWLWQLRVTRDKSIRTFATQLNLLGRYKNWIFQQGQAQLYDYLKEDAPGIYGEIKSMAVKKRWESCGAVWIEMDTNLPGGESLIRQIMYGKRYFMEEFGLENSVLWLPDAFGFSGSLPQIMKKSGIELFMTTKVSWNQYTRFPYDTFWWKGIDGTEVLTHFITTPFENIHTYNTTVTPKSVYETWVDYHQKNVNRDLLVPFGYGDGGGGPKDDMIRRLSWLKKGIKGFVKVEDCAVEEYKKKLLENVEKAEFPVWEDELYLEYHRGTYTTQANIKKDNRRCEFLLREAEILSLLSGNYAEMVSRLKCAWKLLLLNQFHDILPGSSIKEVYEESGKQLAHVMRVCGGVVEDSLVEVVEKSENDLTIFNLFSWDFSGYASISGINMVPEKIPFQVSRDKVMFRIENLKAGAFAVVKMKNSASGECSVKQEKVEKDIVLENNAYRIVVNVKNGSFSSLVHKGTGRELCKTGEELNVFEVYEDKAINSDLSAWDIDYMHQYKCYAKNGVLTEPVEIEAGELFKKIKLRKKVLNSVIEQEIIVYEKDPLIYFNTAVEWRERDCVLKVAFPVDIHADYATYDIQFGNIKRPTHRNTLYDHARFEVPAHKWVDLSEGYFGAALMSDCKYGYSVKGSEMRITLLRSPGSPDDTADRGRHSFSYCFYPHEGDWKQADVPLHAYQFNVPVRIVAGSLKQEYRDMLEEGVFRVCDIRGDGFDRGTNLMVETIKGSEDGEGVIVRLYECKNSRGKANLKLNLPGMKFGKVYLCDLMENKLEEITSSYDGTKGVEFRYAPYEIITVKYC